MVVKVVRTVLFSLVFTIYTASCVAKPVQLADYNAQTFFENYKLICRNYSPMFDVALPDSKLTYQGETSLYKKYTFRTNNYAFVSIYENKAGCVSVVEAKKEKYQAGEAEHIVLAGVCVEYTLDLSRSERGYLDEAVEKSKKIEKNIMILRDNGSVYSKINRRYIHRLIELSGYTYDGQEVDTVSMVYSADDEE